MQLKAFRISNQLLHKINHRRLTNVIYTELRDKFSDEEIFQASSLFDECKCACKLDENCICLYQIKYLDDWFRVTHPRRMKDPEYRARIDKLIRDMHKIFR